MQKLSEKNNFFYLFGALVTLLFSSAMAVEPMGKLGADLFSFLIVLMILVSSKSIHTDRGWRRVVWGLFGVLLLLGILQHFFRSRAYDYLSLLILFLFFLGWLRDAGRKVLFAGPVNINTIVGSVSLYLLLGLTWTTLYLFILLLDPLALKGIESSGSWQQDFPSVAYYSFVTLTTLGYGDILPGNRVVQFLAYMEAITGVFYMAIVVASLVSMANQDIRQRQGALGELAGEDTARSEDST